MKPKHIKQMQAKRRDLTVRPLSKYTFAVESSSDSEATHVVEVQFEADNVVRARCNCLWAQHHGVACSHVMAALEFLAAQKGRTLSFWLDEEEAKRQRNRLFLLMSADDAAEGVWITSRSA